MRWAPWATGLLAGGAGVLAMGWPGAAAAAAGGLLVVLPRPLRVLALLPLAALPLPPLGPPLAWLALALLMAAAACAVADLVTVGREVAVAVAALTALLALAAVALPYADAFFRADPGLAAFFVAGACLASLGAAVAALPAQTTR